MKVSFIIPLYNCLPLTQIMLASLRATVPASLAHEIILVDDGSSDGTREWLATLSAPCRSLLNERNRAFAATCNRGAAAAGGELLFFLNNDLVLLPGWLEPMLAAFRRFPRAGVVGNVQLDHRTGAVDHAGIQFNHQGKPAHITAGGFTRYRKVAAVTGACCGLRSAVWRELGGFDPAYVNGCEDVDLCLRAAAAGYVNVVAARSKVRHHISASAGRKLRDEHNTFRLTRRWQGQIARLAARAWCRDVLAAYFDFERPDTFDHPTLQAACFHWLLRPAVPPAVVRRGVETAMAVERRRWQVLIEQAAPQPPPPAERINVL